MKKSTALILLYFATILSVALLSSCSLHSITSENRKTDPCYYDDHGAIKPYGSGHRVTEHYHFAHPLNNQ